MLNFSVDKTYSLFATNINKKIIADLASNNIETVIFPTIITDEVKASEVLLEKIFDFDWLIFADVYAVEYFVTAFEKLGKDLFELDKLRVLACGEAVSDRLRFSQLHADVVPLTIRTSDILQALQDYVFDETEFAKLKFLVLQEQNSKLKIIGQLRELNSNVTELPIYSAHLADETQIPKLKALLKGGAIDEFIFSTHFDVLNLGQIFQAENLADILAGVTLTATDHLTLQSLKEFRLL